MAKTTMTRKQELVSFGRVTGHPYKAARLHPFRVSFVPVADNTETTDPRERALQCSLRSERTGMLGVQRIHLEPPEISRRGGVDKAAGRETAVIGYDQANEPWPD